MDKFARVDEAALVSSVKPAEEVSGDRHSTILDDC
jgi:hypothetical protein